MYYDSRMSGLMEYHGPIWSMQTENVQQDEKDIHDFVEMNPSLYN